MPKKQEARPDSLAALGGLGIDDATTDDSAQFENLARQVAEVERRYFEDEPLIGAYFVDYARESVEAGRKFSFQEPAEYFRWHDIVGTHGKDAKVNNTHIPIISRIVCERVEGADTLVERRKSVYDVVFDARAKEAAR